MKQLTTAQSVALFGALIGTAIVLPEVSLLGLDFSQLPPSGTLIIQIAMFVLAIDVIYRNLVYDYYD